MVELFVVLTILIALLIHMNIMLARNALISLIIIIIDTVATTLCKQIIISYNLQLLVVGSSIIAAIIIFNFALEWLNTLDG
jgi:hypothetical protein